MSSTPASGSFPVLLCIDAEPDERKVDPQLKPDWLGFEHAVDLIERLRPAMTSATGRPAHLSWFLRMDPQITHVYGHPGWAADRYRAQLNTLLANGDELGIHLHPWQWDHQRSGWTQNFADQSWVAHCVAVAFDAFEQAFGERCRAFRFGDRWMNEQTMDLIEQLGATSDSTIEPGQIGNDTSDEYTGTFPDYTDVPRYAYWPSRRNFHAPTPTPVRDLLIVPVNSAPAIWASTPPVGAGVSRTEDRQLEGTLDAASMVEIAGWVWDSNDPDCKFDVDLWCDGKLLATVGATHHREDLTAAAKGDGTHAFRLATPTHLKDGERHTISARVAGTNVDLVNSPLVLQGHPESDSEMMTLYLDQYPLTFAVLVDRLLAEPTTELLTLKARSDFAKDGQRSANVQRNVEHLLAHTQASNFAFITMSEYVCRRRSSRLQ